MDKVVQQKFCDIYHSATWRQGVSVSGIGSEHEQTEKLVKYLRFLIGMEGVTSIVDCPCGDMNWQPAFLVDLPAEIQFTGIDIVPELIAANTEKFGDTSNWRFEIGDIITNPIPACDLLIVRDCFVHLTNEQIHAALENIKRSPVKLVALTTFPTQFESNAELTPEQWESKMIWRPLNMRHAPFNLPFPTYQLIEQCSQSGGKWRDKCLSVWRVSDLP